MIVTKIEDLIPDVLFVVKKADEISVRHALNEAVEDLAYNHQFFLATFLVKADTRKELFAKARAYVGEDHFIAVTDIESKGMSEYMVTVCLMPLIDEPYPDSDYLTRNRRVITMHAIALMLFQTKEPWGDPEQAAMYSRRANEALESWKTVTHVYGGQMSDAPAQVNPWAIF